ncbi:hypothetical protein RBB50_012047 [Rhinocladiella similis]
MPDNPTNPPQGAPKTPPTTNTPQAGGGGNPKVPPKNWDFVQKTDLGKEVVESSKDTK